jgi:hypothetical protein
MEKHHLKILVPGILAAAALALAVGVGAQTPPASPPAAKSPEATPLAVHHKHGAATAKPAADMKPECEAMMAKKKEMEDKLQAMDATLDKLVAEMNAAGAENKVDAMEKPIAAVVNELVAQRKASRAMKTEMESVMMAHMMKHMEMAGTKAGKKSMTDCPMMKMGGESEAEKLHKM